LRCEREGGVNERLRRVLLGLSGAVVIAAASSLAAVRFGRPLYYSDGEQGHLGAGARLRQAPMLLWTRPQPELELPGSVRGRALCLPDGTFVYGLARGEQRTELVRFDPARREAAPEPIVALASNGHDLGPALSPDGTTLYFASDRPHAEGGGFDVWCASLRAGQAFAPRPLGPNVNTPADETDPAVDPTTLALVFVRRQESLDARGSLRLWSAPPEGGEAQRLFADADPGEVRFDREPAFSPDGHALWFVRQRDFARPTLMQAWRHGDALLEPVAVALGMRDDTARGPSLLEDGRALRFLGGDSGIVYRSRAVEVHPWWEGQAWLEHLLIVTLALALLIWILLALGRRWRALDVVTWCLIASLLLHVFVLLWLRGVEIVRHYRAPPPQLGDIEVTLVASGGSVAAPDEAAPGPELAHELRFSGHQEALVAAAPAPAMRADAHVASAQAAAADVPAPQASTLSSEQPALADGAAAAAQREARAEVPATAAAAAPVVDGTPSPPVAASPRPTARSGPSFVVQVPTTAGGTEAAPGGGAAPAGAFSTAPTARTTPAQPPSLADAAAAQTPVRGQPAGAAPQTAAATAAPVGVATRLEVAERAEPSVSDLPDAGMPTPASALAPAAAGTAPAATAGVAAPPPAAASLARAHGPELHDGAAAVTAPSTAAAAAPTSPLAATGERIAAVPSEALPAARAAPSPGAAEPVVARPDSMVATVATGAAAPSERVARALPEPRDLPAAAPAWALPDPAPEATAVRTAPAAAARGATLALEQPLSAPAAAAVLPEGAPAPPAPLPTLTGPEASVAQAPPLRTPSAARRTDPAAPHSLSAPRVALREAGAAAPPGAILPMPQPSGLAVAGPVPLPTPGLDPTTDAVIAPAPAAGESKPARVVVAPPLGLMTAAAPLLPRAERGAKALSPGEPRVREVALRDAQPLFAPADAQPSARELRGPASAPVAFAGLSPQPLAAAVVLPHRRPTDRGDTEVARGIEPPASVLPLPEPARARAASAHAVAALPELYRARFGPEKVKALEAFGGSEQTEAAVRRGLAYLASIQRTDGAWGRRRRPHDKYGEVWVGKSGLALLAFLGAGHTQDGDTEYAPTVRKALDWLLAQQDPATGHFGETSAYSHGITTYALAECYALTKDERLRGPVERAVAWILQNQNQGRDRRSHGGWGYFSPTLRPEDRFARASVSAWQIMALKSAQASGVNVPAPVLASAEQFLWFMFDADGGYFLYNREPSRLRSEWRTLPGSTPASVFCLLLLGADRAEPRLVAAQEWILQRAPSEYRRYSLDDFVLRARGNVYFWYYGSLACFLAGGEVWAKWNEALKHVLLEGQSDDGSFAPIDEYADYAGDDDRDRAFTTAMCVLSLEVYYRYFTPLLLPK